MPANPGGGFGGNARHPGGRAPGRARHAVLSGFPQQIRHAEALIAQIIGGGDGGGGAAGGGGGGGDGGPVFASGQAEMHIPEEAVGA